MLSLSLFFPISRRSLNDPLPIFFTGRHSRATGLFLEGDLSKGSLLLLSN